MTYVNTIYQAARRLAVGDLASLNERRAKMFEYFRSINVNANRVLAKLEKSSIEDVNLTDIEMLIGISTSITEQEIDIETAFPLPSENGDKNSELNFDEKGGSQKK